MAKLDLIVTKYLSNGVTQQNIEYAISEVREAVKREHIMESLMADYRGMDYSQSKSLLEDLFMANGGEFKKENKGGYLFGTFVLMIGGLCAFYIFYVFAYGGVLVRPVIVFIGAFVGIIGGLIYILKSISVKYRDSDEPFKE